MGGDRLELGPEADGVHALHVEVAEEGVLVAGETVDPEGDGDADVDAHHAAVRPQRKLAGIVAALREDARAVGEFVGVHQGDALLEVLHALDAKHGTENLLVADRHAGLDMVEEGGPEVEALLVTLDHLVPAVDYQLGAFVDSLLDPGLDRFLVLGVYDGPQLAVLLVGGTDLEFAYELHEVGDELVGDRLFHDDRRQGHAALAGGAEGGVHDAARGPSRAASLRTRPWSWPRRAPGRVFRGPRRPRRCGGRSRSSRRSSRP